MIHCKAKTSSGAPCNAKPNASGFCFAHDPERKRERDAARKLGGKHRKRGVSGTPFPDADTKTAQGLTAFLDVLLRETWVLEASIARSRTLAYIVSVQKSVLEVGEIEARISALENLNRSG
jgi:hypothetical protein